MERAEQALAALFSYLDDITLVVPPELAQEARAIVTEELARVGLTTNDRKSGVFTKSGQCPPGCEDWRDNIQRHDGFLLCGRPFDADPVALDPGEGRGDAVVVPVGGPAYVADFLANYATKVETLAEQLVDAVHLAPPEAPALLAPPPTSLNASPA